MPVRQRGKPKLSPEQWERLFDRIQNDHSKTVEQHCTEAGVSRNAYYKRYAGRMDKAPGSDKPDGGGESRTASPSNEFNITNEGGS
jgi:hypothetical protein